MLMGRAARGRVVVVGLEHFGNVWGCRRSGLVGAEVVAAAVGWKEEGRVVKEETKQR